MKTSDERKIDKLSLEDLCAPLSGKDTFRKTYAIGGTELDASKANARSFSALAAKITTRQKKSPRKKI